MMVVIVVALATAVYANPAWARLPCGDPRPLTRSSSVLLPTSAILGGSTVAEVTLVAIAREQELFREKYVVDEATKALVLRLEGAGVDELRASEQIAAGSIRFDILIDGVHAYTWTIPQLLAASAALSSGGGLFETHAVPIQVHVNRTGHANVLRGVDHPVERPSRKYVTRIVTPPSRSTQGVQTNSAFVCPSGQNGTCNDEYWTCNDQCDPSDPGYYEACLARCQEDYNWCYYGQTRVDELRWFQPLYLLGLREGFYPWYAVWDLKMWEAWSGDARYQRRETYYCKYDGTFGPYVVADETTAEVCYHRTEQSADGGAYIDECKF